jgi:putative serine protease PepD
MRSPTRLPILAVITILILAIGGLNACTGGDSKSAGAPSDSSTASAPVALQAAFVDIVNKTLPSVVEITSASGLGSGVIIDAQGNIVTNAHVVGKATKFQVGLAGSSKTYPATLVGAFPPDDLAVIRVNGAPKLKPATWGDSGKLRTGDIVLAVGNPLGLSGSVTDGIVSALGRTVDEPRGSNSPGATIPNAIQTSAAINPGNSGGALVDLNGQLIGVPTLAAVNQEIGNGSAAPGIGFAISGNMAASVAHQLVTQGKVTNSGRAALGVAVQTVVDANGTPVGAGITSVVPNGPAAKAGLAPGDVITKLDSATIATAQDLANALARDGPGQRVSVTVISAASSSPSSRTVEIILADLSSV